MRELARGEHRPRDSAGMEREHAQLLAYVAEARHWLAQAEADESGAETKAKDRAAPPPGAPTVAGNADSGRGRDPRSQLIQTKLDDRISLNFGKETTLEDVIKHIKNVTKSSDFPAGIPVYVDPIGLQEAEKSLSSTVTLELEGVPLRRTLQLVLKQLGLIYFIDDGMMYVTSEGSEPSLGRPSAEPSPVTMRIEKAERGELTYAEMEELLKFLKKRDEVLKAGRGEAGRARAGLQ